MSIVENLVVAVVVVWVLVVGEQLVVDFGVGWHCCCDDNWKVDHYWVNLTLCALLKKIRNGW